MEDRTNSSDVFLRRFLEMHPKKIDLTLERIERLLQALDHPERRLPPVIHIAGTNGKGSVAAILAAICSAAGLRVHRYISPHLVRFHERILLNNQEISEEALQAVLSRCENANAGQPITFFEITTAAAFLAFSEYPADLLILETGLGGRLDATNVVDQPLVTCLTPISMDHQQFLGDSLEQIAAEKAAIIKPGRPVIVARQTEDVTALISARADALKAPLLRQDQEWFASSEAGQLVFETESIRRLLPGPALFGQHQFSNAGCALACMEAVFAFGGECAPDLDIAALRSNGEAIMEGLANAVWPARMQMLTADKHPLARLLPPGWEMWLDGGHNAAAGKVLGETASAKWKKRPLHLIVGMLDGKDHKGFLEGFRPFADLQTLSITTVPVPGEDSGCDPGKLLAIAREAGFNAQTAASPEDAINAILSGIYGPGERGRVLICGSLYLAGQVLRQAGTEQQQAEIASNR